MYTSSDPLLLELFFFGEFQSSFDIHTNKKACNVGTKTFSKVEMANRYIKHAYEETTFLCTNAGEIEKKSFPSFLYSSQNSSIFLSWMKS